MKRILIPTITFVLGVALGIAVMVFIVQRGPNQVISNLVEAYTRQNAIYGTLLYEKRNDDLQRIIEDQFLTSLNLQKGLNLSEEGYRESQKTIRAYFDLTGRPIPAAINQHIQLIPKGTGGNLQRLSDFAADQKTK